MTTREMPKTMNAARAHLKATGQHMLMPPPGEGEEVEIPEEARREMLGMLDESMDAGFVAGVAWLMALIRKGQADKEMREELPILMRAIDVELQHESLVRERAVRKALGDDKVNDMLRAHGIDPEKVSQTLRPKKGYSLKDDGDEPAAPSMRDIEETRAALERIKRGPAQDQQPPKESES